MVGDDMRISADLRDGEAAEGADAAEVDIVMVGACRSRGGEVLHGVGAEACGVEGEGVSATTAQQDVVAAKPVEQVSAVEAGQHVARRIAYEDVAEGGAVEGLDVGVGIARRLACVRPPSCLATTPEAAKS